MTGPGLIGLATLATWGYLLLLRGDFWRAGAQHLAPAAAADSAAPPPRVVAVVPARDEAGAIGTSVRSLLTQDVPLLAVVVVDDGSSDGTAAEARAAAADCGGSARLEVLTGAAPPAGWTGKLWAMQQGVAAARALDPEYLLLTDADIAHEPAHLRGLLQQMRTERLELLSGMVRLSTATAAERWLIPAFVFFFFLLYPPAWAAAPRARTAAAAGGCMLLRARALDGIGGLAALRASIIDDCALARAVKAAGGRIRLGLTRGAHSLRSYGSAAGVGRMISRSAFHQLGHSWVLLALALAGLLLTFAAPPLLLLAPQPARSAGALAWLAMSVAYAPMLREYALGAWRAPALPLVALFYAGATLHSAVQYALGRGGQWKGRVQDA